MWKNYKGIATATALPRKDGVGVNLFFLVGRFFGRFDDKRGKCGDKQAKHDKYGDLRGGIFVFLRLRGRGGAVLRLLL